MKKILLALLTLGCLVILASIVPGPYAEVLEAKPKAGSGLWRTAEMSPESIGTLTRVCANCHSEQTEWPFYSRIAPVSWMIRKDVSEGRKFLNFSVWEQYGAAGQSQLLDLAGTQVREGKMPPSRYLYLHPEAKLSVGERANLSADLLQAARRLTKPEKTNQ